MLTLIVAVSQNSCIGKNGTLPWKIPEDLRYFKNTTMGHSVIMGRKTWESIPEKFRPLAGRKNIIVTRQTKYLLPASVIKASTLEDALGLVANEDAFVIGGAEIYTQAIDHANHLDVTKVEQFVDGDAFFPKINAATWRETNREPHVGYTRISYDRIA